MKRLFALLTLISSVAAAAPFSSRWTVATKQETQDDFIVGMAPSTSQVGWNGAAVWTISTAYAINAVVYNTNDNVTYKATVGGTSASSGVGPACFTGTCTDGTVTWAVLGSGTYPTANVANGSYVVWRFTGSGIYSNAALAVTCSTTTPITPCAPAGDIQIDMQPVAGAAVNALSVRTRWLVQGKYLNVIGHTRNYPFKLLLVPDTTADGSVTTNGIDFLTGPAPSVTIVVQSSAVYAAVTIGTPVYVDFGACSTTCQSTL